MSSRSLKIIAEHWRISLYALFCIAVALTLVVLSRTAGLRVFDYMAERQDQKLSLYLKEETEDLSQKVRVFSKSEELRNAIASKDVPSISRLLEIERKRDVLSALTAVDSLGIALSRVPIAANIGDNIFLTNPLARKTLERGSASGFSVGRNFPLTLSSGELLASADGSTIGVVSGGYWLDNSYAKKFKETYLHDWRHREIVFYSKEEGVTGDSLENVDTENKLRAYLSHASTIIQDGRSGDLLNIDGTDYVITNHLIADEDDVYGGVLLLTPLPLTLFARSMLFSFIIAILFLASLLLIERISVSTFIHFKKKALDMLLVSLSAVVFVSLWVGVYTYGKASTLYLSKPEFTIYNSTMKIRPGAGVYATGYKQQAAIMIYSGGEEVNAVEVHLRFDPQVLQVNSLSFSRSICGQNTLLDKSIDNSNGTVNVSCAITDKAFAASQGVIADIDFTPLRAGNASLSFDEDTHVLAADGLGTDVLRSVTSAYYRVFDEKDLTGFFSTDAIIIPYSPSHENSSKWYSSRRINVVWQKMKGVEYVYELSKNSTTTMENPITTSATAVTLTAPDDGVYYFKIAPKQGTTVGQMVRLRLQIDTTPPDVPTIKASNLSVKKDDIVRFELSSDDALSGLQRNFYVESNGSTWFPSFSKIYMPFHEVGVHTLGVRVFDNAENYSDAAVSVRVKN
jgi:hypothetical protein